jgi:hypothetical protein
LEEEDLVEVEVEAAIEVAVVVVVKWQMQAHRVK